MKKTNDLTEMVFILDKSGSMYELTDDTIGGFNSMIEKQKKEKGRALLTTYLFNDRTQILHDRIDLTKVKPLTRCDYIAQGSTALLDAVGEAVNHITDIHKYAREEDLPEKTVFVITTDGMENSSVKFSRRDVKKLIEDKKELGWEFIFLGANIDAAGTAESIGIERENAIRYNSDSVGQAACYASMSCAVSELRCNKTLSKKWRSAVEKDNASRNGK